MSSYCAIFITFLSLGYFIIIILLLLLLLVLYNYKDDLIDTQKSWIFVKGTVAISFNQLKE